MKKHISTLGMLLVLFVGLSIYQVIPVVGLSKAVNKQIPSSGSVSYVNVFGVQVWKYPNQSLQISRVKDLGVKWIRWQVTWAEIETSKGVYDWSLTDLVVGLMREKGIKPLLLVVYTPSWAREGGTERSPPTNVEDYGNFVEAVVNRYGADVVELMNEPYIFFEGTEQQYVDMITAGYNGAKRANPNCTVVVAYGDGQPTCVGGWYSKFDLTNLYNLGMPFDAIAVHPYTGNQDPDYFNYLDDEHTNPEMRPYDGVAGQVKWLKEKLADMGKAETPIYATEFGYNSDEVGLDLQSEYTVRVCEILKEVGIPVAIYYCFLGLEGYDLVNNDSTLSAKPVFNAYEEFIRNL